MFNETKKANIIYKKGNNFNRKLKSIYSEQEW